MMDKRQLEDHIKALHKAVASHEPAPNVIKLLETLKSESPSEELLRITKAGLTVGKMRSNPNKEIASLATEIVTKWKKRVEAEKAAKARAKTGGSASPAPTASPVLKVQKNNKKYEGDPEKRRFNTDKVDVKRTGSDVRNNCIGLLYNGLAFRSTESEENVLVRAIEVENAGFSAFKGEGKEYKEKIRSLFQNLKVNTELGRGLMSGLISPDAFVVMSSKDLMSAKQRQVDRELEEENMKKAQVPMVEKSISDTLECSGCKKKMVSYTQAQTRSADEPMTTFCECMNCGKRWKFS